MSDGNEFGSLIVYTSEKAQGKEVTATGNGKTLYANVVARTVGGQLTYAAIFPKLAEGRYYISAPSGYTNIDVFGGHQAEVDFRNK